MALIVEGQIQEAEEHKYKCLLRLLMLLAVNNKCRDTSKDVLFRVSALKKLTIKVERKSILEVQYLLKRRTKA